MVEVDRIPKDPGTPQKSNMDTKMAIFKRSPIFSKASFWVSMLVFGDVCPKNERDFPYAILF